MIHALLLMRTSPRTRPAVAAALAAVATLAAPSAWAEQRPDALRQLRGPAGSEVRYQVFTTPEALVADDTNGVPDVYLRDLKTGELELVSRGLDGLPGPHGSEEPSVSGDGRVVAFVTRNAFVAHDTNDLSDVYAVDRLTKDIFLVSRAYDGTAANAPSSQPAVSWSGQYVVFASPASNISRGDSNFVSDIFIWNRATLVPRLITQRPDGSPFSQPSFLPSVSPNGVYVGFRTLERLFADQPSSSFAYFVIEAPGFAGKNQKAIYWVDSESFEVRDSRTDLVTAPPGAGAGPKATTAPGTDAAPSKPRVGLQRQAE